MNTTAVEIPRSRRSSTNRSIRSGFRQPTWRSSPVTKASVAPTVSIVFAEPEQVPPSQSARLAIPSSSRVKLELETESNDEPEKLTHGDQQFVESPERTDVALPVSPPDIITPTASTNAVAEITAEPVALPPTYTQLPNTSLPNLASNESSTEHRRSSTWFSSFSRSKGKAVMRSIPSEEVPFTPSTPPSIVHHELAKSPPRSIPSSPNKEPVLRPSFSSPPTSPLSTTPANAPYPEPLTVVPALSIDTTPSPNLPRPSVSDPKIASSISLPSSIDDAVPSLPPTPPAIQLTQPKLTTTPALNPSSSRFSLAIPFLGRPKVPLHTVIVPKEETAPELAPNASDQDKEPPVTIQADPPVALRADPPMETTEEPVQESNVNLTATETVNVAPPLETSTQPSSENPPFPTPTAAQHSSQPQANSSWWGLIGWSSAQDGGTADPSTTAAPVEEHTDCEAEPPATTTNHADVVEEIVKTEVEERGDEGGEVANQDAVTTETTTTSTTTTTTTTTTSTSTTSASWLNPWAWYPPPANEKPASSVEPELQHEEKAELEPVPEEPPIIEPTIIEPRPELPASRHSSEDIIPNPIEATISSNRSGWASFFSSNTLIVKTLGYGNLPALEDSTKRDENGMEVMDLDEEEEERGRKTLTKNTGGLASPAAVKVSSSGSSVNSLQTTITTNTGKTVEAPPITISDDVKKEVKSGGDASVAGTPKKGRSGTNTPVQSPTPSLPTSKGGSSSVEKSTKVTINGTVTKTAITKTSAASSSTPASPSKRSGSPSAKKPSAPPPPNLVLPAWDDLFHAAPRSSLLPKPTSYVDDQGVGGRLFGKTMRTVRFMGDVLLGSGSNTTTAKGKERESEGLSALEKERRERFKEYGKELPKAWKVFEDAGCDMGRVNGGGSMDAVLPRPAATRSLSASSSDWKNDVLKGCKTVVVIGIHGWFPGAMIRTMLGEPTGTSSKFANMMETALLDFENEHGVKFDKITKIPLEGEGVIEKRVERLYANLQSNSEWVYDLHHADAILVATHSQGSVVSTHLLDRLIQDGHIVTQQCFQHPPSMAISGTGPEAFPSVAEHREARRKVQKVCCLALCGIHLGPLRYLSSSTLVGPYLQYFESTAARELFEFQNTESAVSKAYVKALENVLDHGTKMLYIASLNDQVVPLYSGLFTAATHPLILRALYIDGDAYHTSDFLSNLLVLLLRILNSGIPDSGLIAHLSEATAGSLNGVGHSTAYEEPATYALAVKYLFLTNEGMVDNAKLLIEPFNASHEQNDYEIPWSLRDIIADERVAHFFLSEITRLRDQFREWHPRTSILRDLKRKLQPIQRLPASFSTVITPTSTPTTSKL